MRRRMDDLCAFPAECCARSSSLFDLAGGGAGGPWNTPADTPEVFADEVGAVYGLAYQRSTNSYFMSSYLKRHVGFGPGGPGAIYQLDRNTGAVLDAMPCTSRWRLLPGFMRSR